MTVRVRFAPSPTGYLHIGGARTALYDWLFARHMKGTFILRIEDTDRSRIVEDSINEIYNGLRWLGMEWDEGPDVGGEYGPYVQSERLEYYKEAADKLIESGDAYRCFCTSERLTELRETQRLAKKQPGYDRRCRNLSDEEIQENVDSGLPHVVRLKVPLTGQTRFEDFIRGPVVHENQTLDDFVLLKTDGFPTYHLASVVDDHLMKISHVIRGEEWIPSTPKHVLLYQALGIEDQMPLFVHVPSILSPGGGKLSKRKGAAAVTDFADMGYLPEAVRNFIALLGWSPGDDREKMELDEMIEAFTLERIQPKGAIFDEIKLTWLNGEYISDMTAEQLFASVTKVWTDAGLIAADETETRRAYLLEIIELFKSRMNGLKDFGELAAYCFHDPEDYDAKARKKHWKGDDLAERLTLAADRFEAMDDFNVESAETVVRAICEEKEIGGGKLINPIRLAVCGIAIGPGLFELLGLLGKDTVIRRLRTAIEILKSEG
jgi:glutamyl-tRNA synthetase